MSARPQRGWRSFTGRDMPWPTNRAHHQLLAAQVGVLVSTLGRMAGDWGAAQVAQCADAGPPLVAQLLASRRLPLRVEWQTLRQLLLVAGEVVQRLLGVLAVQVNDPPTHSVFIDRALRLYEEERQYMTP